MLLDVIGFIWPYKSGLWMFMLDASIVFMGFFFSPGNHSTNIRKRSSESAININIHDWLVVWTPLKNMKVTWDNYSQYSWENKKKWQPNHQPDELFPKIHGKTSWVSDQAWEHFGKSHKFRTTLLAGQVTEPSKPPGAGLTDWQGPLRVGRLFQGSAAFVYQDLTHS